MIRHQMPFHNLALLLLRQRVEDRSQLPAYLAENYFPSTFGNEDDMVPAVPLGVGLVVAEAVHVIFIELHLIGSGEVVLAEGLRPVAGRTEAPDVRSVHHGLAG
jgi:hypothetical protein